DSATVLGTTDAGDSWTVTQTGGNYAYRGICGVNEHLWIVGDSAGVRHSINGKVHIETNVYYNGPFYAVHFLDSSNGIAVGKNGVYLRYSFGNWDRSPLHNEYDLHAVYFAEPGDFFVAGTSGNLITVIDGVTTPSL